MIKYLYFALMSLFSLNITGQTANKTPENVVDNKIVNITEFGFLMGEENSSNNYGGGYPYPAGALASKSSYFADSYPPIYYGTQNLRSFTVQNFTGYKVNNRLTAGVTVGLDWYNYKIAPISLGIRSDLKPNKRVSPFLGLDFGYGFIINQKKLNKSDDNYTLKTNGGLMINPTIGYRVKVGNDGSTLNFNVGYRIQKSSTYQEWPKQVSKTKEERTFSRLSIRMGFGF